MTMKELARLAGVSSAAVSRYLNGGSLSPEKREIIRRAIAETGYQPDAAAQALRTKTTDIVGLIVPKLDSESVSRLAAGAAAVLSNEGYLCQFAISHNDPERELFYLSLFRKHQVAGAIVVGTTDSPRHGELREQTFPVVVTGQKLKQTPCVYYDDAGAAAELTRLLLARGRRKVCYLSMSGQEAVGPARRQGVVDALREAGLEILAQEAASSDLSDGRAAMERLLAVAPEVDAVVCATDRIAFGAMEALRAAGREIPRDVSVVGMGDSWACEMAAPQLTTAHFYYRT